MASFYVECKTCQAKLQRKLKRAKREMTREEYESLVLFETEHSVHATDAEIAAALVCPRCDGSDCAKTFYGYNNQMYIRGNGYLDKAGCQRDMNLFKLETEDPYGEMRVPGEVEDIKGRLKKAGRHDPKTQTFVQGGAADMQKAVKKSVTTKESPTQGIVTTSS